MTRSLLVIVVAAIAAAGLVALMSRTPASVRARPPVAPRTDPTMQSSFSDADVARHGAYRRGTYAFLALQTLLQLTVLLALVGPVSTLAERFDRVPGGWLTRAVAVAALVTVVSTAAALPVSFVRGYAMEHAWGLSTQDAAGWMSDQLKSAAIGVVFAAVAAVAYFGLLRAFPRWWWVAGWVVFSLLSAVLTFAAPVVIAPLFNDFEPVRDERLVRTVRDLGAKANIELGDVLVVDAARRTTAENAYVAGLGATKRMVLYDNLVEKAPPDEVAFVVAHELAHAQQRHVPKSLALASAGLLAGFAALAFVITRPAVLGWIGAAGPADVRTIPVVMILAVVIGIVLLPAQNGVSRRFESHADAIAVRLTGETEAAIRSFRRLAFSNLADLRPPRLLVWLLYTHPPIPDRIRAMAEQSAFP